MTRCPSRHPYTDRQCTHEQGHLALGVPHKPEEHTLAEAEQISLNAARDVKALISDWQKERVPYPCMLSTLMGAYVQMGKREEYPDAELLRTFVEMMGDTEPGPEPLSRSQLLIRIGAMLELDCPVP